MVFYISAIISLISFVFYSYKSAKNGVMLSPQMIFWGVIIYVIYYPAWLYSKPMIEDNAFNMVFLLGTLGALAACVFYRVPAIPEDGPKIGLPNKVLHVLALPYFCYLLFSILIIIVQHGGIIAALTFSKLDQYLQGGILKGQLFDIMMIIPKVSYYFLITRYFMDPQKRYIAIALVLLICVFYIFTSNTRLPIIMPLVAITLLFINISFARHMRAVMPVFLILGISALLFYSVIGNVFRNGKITEISHLASNIDTYFEKLNKNQLGYYDWVHDLYIGIEEEEIELDYGKAIYYYAPISFMPRAFWSGKPITSTSNRLTEEVYSLKVGQGAVIYTFTIIGEGYWQLGYAGAFIFPFLMIYMYCVLIHKIGRFQHGEYWAMMTMLQMLPFVRAELPTVHFLLTLGVIFMFKILSQLRWSTKHNKNELPQSV